MLDDLLKKLSKFSLMFSGPLKYTSAKSTLEVWATQRGFHVKIYVVSI